MYFLRLTRPHLVVPTRCELANILGQCGIRLVGVCRGRNDRRQTCPSLARIGARFTRIPWVRSAEITCVGQVRALAAQKCQTQNSASTQTTERNHEITALALKSLRDIFYLKRHSRTGKPLRGKYAIEGYEETRRVFFEQLEELRKQAREPLAFGMPASGPGLLPILEIVATLVFIESPWWFKDEMPDDDESP